MKNLLKLADSVGQFIEYWGFKSIHGRVWTLLYLSERPLSSLELSQILKVSKTLLSFSVAELLKYHVIVDAGKGIKRTQYFRANPDLAFVILNVLKTREQILMNQIYSNHFSLEKLPVSEGSHLRLNAERVGHLGFFIKSAQEVLSGLIQILSQDPDLVKNFLEIARMFSK